MAAVEISYCHTTPSVQDRRTVLTFSWPAERHPSRAQTGDQAHDSGATLTYAPPRYDPRKHTIQVQLSPTLLLGMILKRERFTSSPHKHVKVLHYISACCCSSTCIQSRKARKHHMHTPATLFLKPILMYVVRTVTWVLASACLCC